MATGAVARRRARQNNAYRLGGASNLNRARLAQQTGARRNNNNNGGGNNQNNQQ